MNCDWRMLSIITLFTIFCPMPVSVVTCFVVDVVVVSFTGISINFILKSQKVHTLQYLSTLTTRRKTSLNMTSWGAHKQWDHWRKELHSQLHLQGLPVLWTQLQTHRLFMLLNYRPSESDLDSHHELTQQTHFISLYVCVCVCILFRVLLAWTQVILQQWKTCCVACAA